MNYSQPMNTTDPRSVVGEPTGSDRIERAIRKANAAGRPAFVAFLTAGYPTVEKFEVALDVVAAEADVIEIGVPFSDPMADGVTIQQSTQVALDAGVTLSWILECASRHTSQTPLVLMSYLNPLLAFGIEELAYESRACGIDGVIVPDLPYEECRPFLDVFESEGLALIQLVSPVTPPERLKTLCNASRGFVYAVTTTGTTGGRACSGDETTAYLNRVRAVSRLPVLAGFGIRSAKQVRAVASFSEGVIVGSALVEVLAQGGDPAEFLRGLRPHTLERTEEE